MPRIVAEVPNAHLVIVGKNNREDVFLQELKSLSPVDDHIHLEGFQPMASLGLPQCCRCGVVTSGPKRPSRHHPRQQAVSIHARRPSACGQRLSRSGRLGDHNKHRACAPRRRCGFSCGGHPHVAQNPAWPKKWASEVRPPSRSASIGTKKFSPTSRKCAAKPSTVVTEAQNRPDTILGSSVWSCLTTRMQCATCFGGPPPNGQGHLAGHPSRVKCSPTRCKSSNLKTCWQPST